MIRVTPQNEPPDFNAKVREPGRRSLIRLPRPKGNQWKSRAYWTRIIHELHDSYGGICAYSCHWISYDTGQKTVEHFEPKDEFPELAYEWSNYRLVAGILNGRKGTNNDVLDPFTIEDGWFTIDFSSLMVKPGEHLDNVQKNRVWATINRLGLNEEQTCKKSRRRYVLLYCQRKFDLDHLRDEAPFLASELVRQGLTEAIRTIMGFE